MRLLGAEVHEDGRHGLEAETPGSNEALMAADDYAVIVPGNDGLKEAELTQASGEAVELLSADLAGVFRVRVQVADRNVDDLQVGAGCWHLPSWSRGGQQKRTSPS